MKLSSSTARRLTTAAVALLVQQAVATPLVLPFQFHTVTKTIAVKSMESTVERGSAIVQVGPGDSLTQIAAQYGVGVKTIKWASGINKDNLKPGMLLRVPLVAVAEHNSVKLPPGVMVHEVQAGDTLSSIAGQYGLSIIELISANPYTRSLDHMKEGDRLFIPSAWRGLIVRIKPGQDVVQLADFYRVDMGAVARANNIKLPSDLAVGDYLLLPGVMAEGTLDALNDRRQREIDQRRKQEMQERYERYLVFVARKKQEKYERYLAFVERKKQERYQAFLARKKQEKYDRYLAFVADKKARKAEEARQAAIVADQSRRAAARAEALEKQQKLQQQQAAAARRTVAKSKVMRASFDRDTSAPANNVSSSSNVGFQWPMRSFTITSGYGTRGFWIGSSNFHTGIDLAASVGTPIYAASTGQVTAAGWGSYGINVFVSNGNMRVIYGHMSRTAVRVGETVSRGDLLGYVGCTGICTGPHLHFEVQVNGRHVNPYSYLP